jgi:hypothetical protein
VRPLPTLRLLALAGFLLPLAGGCSGSDDRRGGSIVQPTPRPGSSQPDDPDATPEPEPTASEPQPQAADTEEPPPEDDDPPEADAGLVVGEVLPVPPIPDETIADWKKTGGRSNVSAPAMPTPGISPDQCEDIADGGPVDGCITAEIGCEQRIIGHTKGGIDQFDGRFYEKKFCWPNTRDHDGGNERVYKLVMPEGEWRAWATLYTPCADLDLAGVRHDFGGCPNLSSKTGACEMTIADSTSAERIEMTSQTKKPGQRPVWYIIVEGKNDEEGPFELHVQCREGVGGTVDP